jgi:TRAP-type uncharacterized transport system fused permease subunit
VGDWLHIAMGIAGGFAGIYALTVTTEGWMLAKVGWLMRIFMAAVAVMLFHPDLRTDLVGWAILLGVLLIHLRQVRSADRREAVA